MHRSTVVVHPDAATLAATTAARLLLHLVDAQSTRRPLHVVLTGGGLGTQVLSEVATSPLRDAVDWTGVHLWWGDERFLATGDPDRNETQARSALIAQLPIPAGNVHPIPGPDSDIDKPEDAAERYATTLAAFAPASAHTDDAGPPVPEFDVVLLGVGPDGHIASLFPGHEALEVTDRAVVGVHRSPKPPPVRVSLTFPALEAAAEIWLVVAGADKSEAVGRALAGDDIHRTPAAGAKGRTRTLWLLDTEVAAER